MGNSGDEKCWGRRRKLTEKEKTRQGDESLSLCCGVDFSFSTSHRIAQYCTRSTPQPSLPTQTRIQPNVFSRRSRKNSEWKTTSAVSVCEKQTKKKSESEDFLHFSKPNSVAQSTKTFKMFHMPSTPPFEFSVSVFNDVGRTGVIWRFHFAFGKSLMKRNERQSKSN